MDDQYIRSTDTENINEENTFLWLFRGDLREETESEKNSSTRSGITNQISCDKNITNRNRQ